MEINLFDEIKLFLPKYLSPESEKALFEGLEQFPENINQKMFTMVDWDNNDVYQGDGYESFTYFKLPELVIQENIKVIILSNTCDISVINDRYGQVPNISYTPLIDLEKYKEKLLSVLKWDKDRIDSHIDSIKKQKSTGIYYIPKNTKIKNEAIIFFDQIISVKNNFINRKNISERRLFRLNNLGFYLFLFKISMHFTRMNEKIDRK